MKIIRVVGPAEKFLIQLSTDNTRNMNFIIGKNASGKTLLFNKIKSCFSSNAKYARTEVYDSPYRQKTDQIISLHDPDSSHTVLCTEDVSCDMRQIFVDEETLYEILEYVNGLRLPEEALQAIINRANLMLQKIHGVFDLEECALRLENGQITCSLNLASGPMTICYITILVAFRAESGIELPLIVDGCTDRVSGVFRQRLVQMIADNVAQSLIMITDVTFLSKCGSDLDDDSSDLSVYEYLKNNKNLGFVYELKRGGAVSIYD